MNAAGGAWDNAKKMNEKDGQKGSFKHNSTVVGDTVGDSFKDTSSRAINIQIKLMSYISVVLVPVFENQKDYWWVSLIIIGVVLLVTPQLCRSSCCVHPGEQRPHLRGGRGFRQGREGRGGRGQDRGEACRTDPC